MIIGLATFGAVTFASYVEYPPRQSWTQYCPNIAEWTPYITLTAGIARCEDAN